MKAKQETMQLITKDMTIGQVFENYPQKAAKLADVMTNHGLHCVGCHVNVYETIEQGIMGHGMTKKELDSLLKGMNAVLMEKEEAKGDLKLTKTAAAKVKELMKKEKKQGYGLRIAVEAGGCAGSSYALYFDKEVKGDHVLKQDGVTAYIKPEHFELLKGTEVDYVDGLQGAGFKFNNPNAKKACGCGHSAGF